MNIWVNKLIADMEGSGVKLVFADDNSCVLNRYDCYFVASCRSCDGALVGAFMNANVFQALMSNKNKDSLGGLGFFAWVNDYGMPYINTRVNIGLPPAVVMECIVERNMHRDEISRMGNDSVQRMFLVVEYCDTHGNESYCLSDEWYVVGIFTTLDQAHEALAASYDPAANVGEHSVDIYTVPMNNILDVKHRIRVAQSYYLE